MPSLTPADIDKSYSARLLAIYDMEQADRRDAYDLFRASLARMWRTCPSGRGADRQFRAYWRRVARDQHATLLYNITQAAVNRHRMAKQHRNRMLDLIGAPEQTPLYALMGK